MFLFKYGRFIRDFVGFYGCLLDRETKLKGRAKWSFFKISDIHSPRLATSSPRLIKFLQA